MNVRTLRFQAVSLQQIEQALDTEQAFWVDKGENGPEPCKLRGPLVRIPEADQIYYRNAAKKLRVSGLNYNQPFDAYLIGFQHYTHPDKRYSNAVSHGIIYIQNNMAPELDVLA